MIWIREAVDLLTGNERKKDILIVRLEGELDHHHAEEIRKSLDELLEDSSIRHLILDLRNLNFMDSSGIGVFIGRYKTISKRGGQVCITNVNPQLARILDVSGLYRILKVYNTVEQAVDGIRGEAV
ncbi:MAG TPA: anti-sigma F factor antagonist [Clostridiales bacterium]|nr:anti-sigma F factor antagonist [Clostridiales bacterium]